MTSPPPLLRGRLVSDGLVAVAGGRIACAVHRSRGTTSLVGGLVSAPVAVLREPIVLPAPPVGRLVAGARADVLGTDPDLEPVAVLRAGRRVREEN
jgi:hypothetical protein